MSAAGTTLPTYEECVEKAARVFAEWLDERDATQENVA